MRSASELKKVAKRHNEMATQANEARAAEALESVTKLLEAEALAEARAGRYAAMSPNLADGRWRKGTSLTQEEMEKFLWDGLRNYFEPQGFRCEGENSNYFILCWGG